MTHHSLRMAPLPLLAGAECVRGSFVRMDTPRHCHARYVLGLVERGERLVVHGENKSTVRAGEMFLVPHGQAHSCSARAAEGHDYAVLSLPPEKVEALLASLAPRGVAVKEGGCGHIREPGPGELFRSLLVRPEGVGMGELRELFQEVERHIPIPVAVSGEAGLVGDVKAYLAERIGERTSLRDIARSVHLSPAHLQRSFVRHRGVSPTEEFLHLRIKTAIGLLRQGISATTAAQETGFTDQSHFTRFFKRFEGVTPGRFRMANCTD